MSSPQAPSSLLGQVIAGRYLLTAPLGRGGMGEVFRASDLTLPREVALKLLLSHRLSPENRERFLREARAMALLDHPGVARVLDAGERDDGTPFLALELLRGTDLRRRLREGPLPAELALSIGVEVCDALQAAHDRGIVHRDLKPANLFLAQEDGGLTVKILDFGLARLEDDEISLTRSGTILGTPAYMSPEQARGESAIDARADLYSLAVTLYEALSGRLPFEAESRAALLLKVLRDPPQPIRRYCPALPTELEQALLTALSRDREARYPSARAFGQALRACALRLAPPESSGEPRLALSSPVSDERRLVAVLYAEGARGRALVEAARAEGGWAEPLYGDRAVALFGLEGSFGDEAARAVRAALRSRGSFVRACVATARVDLAQGGPILEPLLEVVFGLAGASREGSLVVDGETYRQLRDRVDAEEEAEGLWRVSRERPQTLTAWARAPLARSPVFGREAELAQLKALLDKVLDERQPLAVSLVGPAGVGKSRLCRELAHQLDAREGRFFPLFGRAEPLRAQSPFSLVADILRHKGQLTEGAAPEERQRRLAQVVSLAFPSDPAAAQKPTHALGELLGIEFSKSEVQRAMRADPQAWRTAIEEGVASLLRGVAQTATPILLLEDLHFADGASLALLEQLLWRCQGVPLLIAGCARPELYEEHPQLFSGHEHVRLEVRPLGRRAVERMTSAILGAEPPAPLLDFLAARAGGVPFFVEELLWALRDRGLLDVREDGSLALLGDLDSAGLPHGVEGVLQARLDRLPSSEKELLKRASVFGQTFWEEALHDLGLLAPGEALLRLRGRELITQRSPSLFQGTAEYTFRHALLREVAYSLLPESERRTLHLQAAEWLRGRSEQEATVALHLDLGGDAPGAAAAYLRAGDLARDAYAVPEALRCYERALDLMPAATPERFGPTLHRARLLRQVGRWRESRDAAQEAAILAGKEPGRAARAYSELAQSAKELQEHDTAERAMRTALDHAQQSGQPAIEGDVFIAAANLAEDLGDRNRARGYVERALESFGKSSIFLRQRGHALKTLGRMERRAGRVEAARACYAEALEIARACEDRALESHLYNNLGILAHTALELDEAIRCYQQSIALTEATGAAGQSGRRLGNLGQAYLSLGRIPEALDALDRALAWDREFADRIGLADSLSYAALARLARGEYEAALRLAEEGVAVSRAVADPYFIGHSACALGECLLAARRNLPRAVQLGREAREVGRASSLPDIVLRGLVLCARAYAAAGEEAAARGEAAAALRVSSQGGLELQWIIEAHLVYHDLVAPYSPEDAHDALAKARSLVERQAAQIRNPDLRASFLAASPQREILSRFF